MAKIEEEVTIKTSADNVYLLISKTENIAKLVNIMQAKIIEQDEEYRVSDIKINTEKETFSWRQREAFDPDMRRIDYSYLHGDWKMFYARFQVTSAGDESELILHVEIEPKEEGIKAYINFFFFKRKMQEVIKDILNAVKDRLELSYGQST